MRRILEDSTSFIRSLGSCENQLIVLSTYFTSKQDPVRGGFQKYDNFSYLESWYNSVLEHNLIAFVFYDSLSESFVGSYQNENIRFIKCQLGLMSLNDERFFIFREFLDYLSDNCFVLTTDINDVIINKNPTQLLLDEPSKLFIGRSNRKVWRNGNWVLFALRSFVEKGNYNIGFSFFNYPVFNPGTLAGSKSQIQKLFDKMLIEFKKLGDDGNYDMQVFNYVIKEFYFPKLSKFDKIFPFGLLWRFFYVKYRIQRKLEGKYKKNKYDLSSHQESIIENDRIYAGFPFVSMFNWYENPSEAYLIHK